MLLTSPDFPEKLQNDDCQFFDYVIAADCLFLSQYHEDLIHVLDSVLHPLTGTALLFAPARNGTLQAFLSKVQQCQCRFSIEVIENYDSDVWKIHQHQLVHHSNSNTTNINTTSTECCSHFGCEHLDNERLYLPDLHYPILVKLTRVTPS
jgi:hypothetical protein